MVKVLACFTSCTVDSGLGSWSGGESVNVLTSCMVDSGLGSWSGGGSVSVLYLLYSIR